MDNLAHLMKDKLVLWSERDNMARFGSAVAEFSANPTIDTLGPVVDTVDVCSAMGFFDEPTAFTNMCSTCDACFPLLPAVLGASASADDEQQAMIANLGKLSTFWSKVVSFPGFAEKPNARARVTVIRWVIKQVRLATEMMQARIAFDEARAKKDNLDMVIRTFRSSVEAARKSKAGASGGDAGKEPQISMDASHQCLHNLVDLQTQWLQVTVSEWLEQTNEVLRVRVQRLGQVAYGTRDGTPWSLGCDDAGQITAHFNNTVGAMGSAGFNTIEKDVGRAKGGGGREIAETGNEEEEEVASAPKRARPQQGRDDEK